MGCERRVMMRFASDRALVGLHRFCLARMGSDIEGLVGEQGRLWREGGERGERRARRALVTGWRDWQPPGWGIETRGFITWMRRVWLTYCWCAQGWGP